MAEQKNWWGVTLRSSTNLSDVTAGTGALYKAIAIDDGAFAVNGKEAGGILQYGANSDQFITIGWFGEMKYVAGEQITAGQEVTVTTSGYFVLPTSGSYVVGRNLENTVNSGSVGRGLFDFSNPRQFDVASAENLVKEQVTFTTATNMSAATSVGRFVDIANGTFSTGPNDAYGVLLTAVASGLTAVARVSGQVEVAAGGVINAGRSFTVDANGRATDANSGQVVVGRSIDASAAGNSGGTYTAVLAGAPHYATSCLDVVYG